MLRALLLKSTKAASGIYTNAKLLRSSLFHLTTQSEVDVEVAEANKEFDTFFGSPLDQDSPATLTRTITAPLSSKEMNDGFLTHVDRSGSAQMVDVSQKSETFREAGASSRVCLSPEAFIKVKENQIKKGDVLTVSKIAGIVGAKHTSLLLPLCHNINLNHVDVDLTLEEASNEVLISTKVSCSASTGVEMEALMSAAIASLNVIDMVKAVDKDAFITDLKLDFKKGGKSGTYIRNQR